MTNNLIHNADFFSRKFSAVVKRVETKCYKDSRLCRKNYRVKTHRRGGGGSNQLTQGKAFGKVKHVTFETRCYFLQFHIYITPIKFNL